MGPPEKRRKGRRESQVFKELRIFENPEDDEELVALYRNKNFVPPAPRQFETLFEGPRRGLSEEGELLLGRNQGKRYIEAYQYWKQNDKEKNRRRKLMIQKQFKGRKRIKPKPLTLVDEERLQKLVDTVTLIDEDNDSTSSHPSDTALLLARAASLLCSLSGSRNQEDGDNFQEQIQEPTQPCPPTLVFTQEIRSIASPSAAVEELEGMDTDGELEIRSKSCSQSSEGTMEESSGDRILSKECGDEPALSSVELDWLDGIQDERLKAEFLAALHSTDIMFCDPVPAPAPKRTKERVSMRRSVRRSARFIKDVDSTHAGSVFSIQTVALPPGRVSKLEEEENLARNQQVEPTSLEPVEPTVETGGDSFSSGAPKPGRKQKKTVKSGSQSNSGKPKKATKPADIYKGDNDNMEVGLEIQERFSRKRGRKPAMVFVEDKPGTDLEVSNLNLNSGRSLVYPTCVSSSRPESQGCEDTMELVRSSPGSPYSRRMSSEINISLPAVVRRSLTGEFVPPRLRLGADEELELDPSPPKILDQVVTEQAGVTTPDNSLSKISLNRSCQSTESVINDGFVLDLTSALPNPAMDCSNRQSINIDLDSLKVVYRTDASDDSTPLSSADDQKEFNPKEKSGDKPNKQGTVAPKERGPVIFKEQNIVSSKERNTVTSKERNSGTVKKRKEVTPVEQRSITPKNRKAVSSEERTLFTSKEQRKKCSKNISAVDPIDKGKNPNEEKRTHAPKKLKELGTKSTKTNILNERRTNTSEERITISPKEKIQTTPKEKRTNSPRENRPITPSQKRLTTKEQILTSPKENRPTISKEKIPTTPKEKIPTTPKEKLPSTPNEKRNTPKTNRLATPKEKIPTPKEKKTNTPQETITTAPKEKMPAILKENKSTSLKENRLTTPIDKTPTTPKENGTNTPKGKRTHTPKENRPITPSQKRSTTPREKKTNTPREEHSQGISSDSEEEVIISGIFGRRTLGPRMMAEKKLKSNNIH